MMFLTARGEPTTAAVPARMCRRVTMNFRTAAHHLDSSFFETTQFPSFQGLGYSGRQQKEPAAYFL
jgi:hypothetical protein